MRKCKNSESVIGRVYSHDLAIKEVKNESSANYGKPFINGTINIAVDEEGLNVIPVHYTYVTEMTNSGKKNFTYDILKQIIDDNKVWAEVGKDEALIVKANPSLGLNDFYNQDNQLVSTKVNEGGFLSTLKKMPNKNDENNTFICDMVITNVVRKEADPDNGIAEDIATIKGAIFDFKNSLLPIDFVIKNPQGIDYFESLDASPANPIFTQVWGKINCVTVTSTKTEETAFGEEAVKTFEKKTKEWLITGSKKFVYDFGDEGVLTAEELTKAMQDRNVYLADVQQRSQEYRESKKEAAAAPATQVQQGTFDF